MLKRLVAIVTALALVVGTVGAVSYESKAAEYEGNLRVAGAQVPAKKNNAIYLKGTDTYLAGGSEDWDSASAILKTDTSDEGSGIWVNDTKQESAFLKKYDGTKNYYYAEAFSDANSGDVVTIKGTFHSQDGLASVVISESKFQWNGIEWIDYGSGSNYKETLTFDSGNEKSMYLTCEATDEDGEVMRDENWDLKLKPVDGESGVYLNEVRLEGGYMKKVTGGNWYTGELGAKAGDVLTIRGTFGYSDNGHSVTIQEINLCWNGSTWAEQGAVTDFAGTLSLTGAETDNTNNTMIFLKGTDGYLSSNTNAWTGLPEEKLVADASDSESGVWLDGIKQTDAFLKKYSGSNNWYLAEGFDTPNTDSVVTIKGKFYSQDGLATVTFAAAEFEWNGSKWVESLSLKEYTGSLTVEGAETDNTNSVLVYLKGTDEYLKDNTNAWTDLPEEKLVADASDSESGVWLDDTKQTGALLKKYSGSNNLYLAEAFGTPKTGSMLVIKGKFYSGDGLATVTFSETKLQWDGIKWADYVERVVGDNYKETLSFTSGDDKHMYLLPMATEEGGKTMPDENWELAMYPLDDNSGLYINGVKVTGGYMKRVPGGTWYTGDWSVQAGDVLTIKGTFGYSDNGHTTTFEEIKLGWDVLSWTEYFDTSTVPCKDITLKKLHNVTNFSTDQNQWKLYIEVDGTVPGEIDVTHFQGVEVDINGTVYKLQGAHSHDDTFYLGISGDLVPQFPKENVKITIKAGRYVTPDKTTGVNIKKDFSLYVSEYGISEKGFLKPYVPNEKNVKVSIDRDRAWGGNENGIYLLTGDKFPVDETWSTLIRGVGYDENSGIFYNDQKIESLLKKYEDGRIYIDLLTAGITAKDKDKVTIKGTFYLDDYAVSYKEYTLYYNGKAWNESYFKQKVKYVNITGQSIHPVSWFDEPTKQWKVYIIVDGKLPGSQDAMSFEGLEIVVNGKKLDTLTHHSHEGCLYFGIPEEYLSSNPKDGIEITVKAGKALAANRVEGIKWTKDFTFYTYMGSLTSDKPTKNTKWQDITIESTPGVLRYSEDSKRWNLFLKTNVELETEHTTQYLKLPVYLNGKKVELTAAKEHEYLFIWIPEDILPANAGKTTLTIKKGATAVANAGRNGIRFAKDFSLYLFNGVWSIYEFDETIHTEVEISGVQNTEYAKGADGVNHWNIYLWADSKIPGTAWYEQYRDFTVCYNGKEVQVQLSKAYSSNSRLLHFPLYETVTGKAKEGDILTIKPHTATCGGYEIEFTNTFQLVYRDGVWSQYVKSDVKEPANDKSLWEMARFEDGYIPFTERGTVTFSSSDKYNRILSADDLMDYTVNFSSTKLTDDTATAGVSVVLRGNAIDDETDLSTGTLYGYVVQFYLQSEQIDEDNVNWIGCVNVWKNGRKDGLIDAYRIAYARDTENPFFWFNEAYDYEFSIYNVTETCVCITVKVNGEVVLRCYDEASDDPMDPAVNPGKFGVFAESTASVYDDIYEVGEVLATSTSCEVGEAVWVAGSYPYVLEKTAFAVDSEGAKVSNGVFKATEPGTYTVSCTYDGKELKPITITATAVEEEGEEQVVEDTNVNWLPLGIGAAVVVLLGAAGIILLVRGKRKKKA